VTLSTTGAAPVEAWYTEAYDLIREITGLGEGKGPWIAIRSSSLSHPFLFHPFLFHSFLIFRPPLLVDDGFNGVTSWEGFLSGADRVSLDTHTYIAFDTPQHNLSLSAFPEMACKNWGQQLNQSMENFGLTHSGEWSMAVNDW
jgi:glucan 1,3-beta-glucosidase